MGAGWAILVLIDYLAAPEPITRMLDITGQILGNLPSPIVVVLTVFIGFVLGSLGGLFGVQLAQLVPALRLFRQPIKQEPNTEPAS